MAEFKAEVVELKIEEHPNADALELAVVGDYRAVVRKGDFVTGDWGIYIPEQAIVPLWLIEQLGLEGRLAGKEKNRVKPVKLRGQLSQGLVMPVFYVHSLIISYHITVPDKDGNMHNPQVHKGDDVTELLGITKWEPHIPTAMNGKCWNAMGKTIRFDIQSVKRYPDVLKGGEEVVMTEKLHGTWCCFGKHGSDYIVTSKGLSDRGLAFTLDADNEKNLYVRYFLKQGGKEILDMLVYITGRDKVYILGEIFGPVQDLKYGMQKATFRIFDIYVGDPNGRGTGGCFYFNPKTLLAMISDINILNAQVGIKTVAEIVPILYHGPFSRKVMEEYTNGMETVSGNQEHIREGIVINPIVERSDPELGRVVLKSVSEDYLLRKNKDATEFN